MFASHSQGETAVLLSLMSAVELVEVVELSVDVVELPVVSPQAESVIKKPNVSRLTKLRFIIIYLSLLNRPFGSDFSIKRIF